MPQAEGTTEQHEEVVDLFSTDFDDKSLEEGQTEGSSEGTGAGTGHEAPAIPGKYEGKSIHDVIEMHQHLERAYGRHNNELGELRQLTDQILKQQLSTTTEDSTDALDQDDLLNDPAAAINRTVESNEKVRELEERLNKSERAEQLATFNRNHPDANKVVNDPRFLEWVQASPTRVRLLQQANTEYDYGLAGELITTFEGVTPGDSESTEGDKTAMKNATRNATGGKGGKKQYFKRADLMRLKSEDPDRYEKLQPQILAAYAENRVR